jgi:hypothetical protein
MTTVSYRSFTGTPPRTTSATSCPPSPPLCSPPCSRPLPCSPASAPHAAPGRIARLAPNASARAAPSPAWTSRPTQSTSPVQHRRRPSPGTSPTPRHCRPRRRLRRRALPYRPDIHAGPPRRGRGDVTRDRSSWWARRRLHPGPAPRHTCRAPDPNAGPPPAGPPPCRIPSGGPAPAAPAWPRSASTSPPSSPNCSPATPSKPLMSSSRWAVAMPARPSPVSATSTGSSPTPPARASTRSAPRDRHSGPRPPHRTDLRCVAPRPDRIHRRSCSSASATAASPRWQRDSCAQQPPAASSHTPPGRTPVGFQNSTVRVHLRLQAARSYSLTSPPSTGRRLIRR